ncbi:MAG: hypothetical protein N2505_00435 [Endomicrobia bacterium]|nr:hypothetical protein [Endomicrobiia bacterium]
MLKLISIKIIILFSIFSVLVATYFANFFLPLFSKTEYVSSYIPIASKYLHFTIEKNYNEVFNLQMDEKKLSNSNERNENKINEKKTNEIKEIKQENIKNILLPQPQVIKETKQDVKEINIQPIGVYKNNSHIVILKIQNKTKFYKIKEKIKEIDDEITDIKSDGILLKSGKFIQFFKKINENNDKNK